MSESLPIPSDDRIASLSRLLKDNIKAETINHRYAPIKHVLTLIGLAGVAGITFFSPGGASLGKMIFEEHRREKEKEWRQYNPWYLRRSLARLHKRKLVETADDGEVQTVMLTELGKRRILKYALDELTIPKPKHWDGKWRMIIYDVDERKKKLRDIFRCALQTLGFYKLQGSIWIYPYPCEEQVTFLREYYGVGNDVLYVVATRLEDDAPYRSYFGIEA
ncbi:MAG: hypothetical protein AAB542_04370 [Patescibacteria group bacterium]